MKDSIKFEVFRKDEAACEPIVKFTGVGHKGQIGVLLKNESIFREFKYDCWSYKGGQWFNRKDQHPDRLYASKPNNVSNHAEAWAHMDQAVCGIVVCGMNIWQLTKERRNTILNAAAKYDLAVYRFVNGSLQKEEL